MVQERAQSEYVKSGVDYAKIAGFKQMMSEMGKRTHALPEARQVSVLSGGLHQFWGVGPHLWKSITEGLGNKNWIASWMEKNAGDRRSYYTGIGEDTMRMATNDLLMFRALPVIYTDEVAAGIDEWFSENPQRAADLVASYYRGCVEDNCALVQGESPALKYLINTLPEPGKDQADFHCPSFSGCAVGIVSPARRWTSRRPVAIGDAIVGALSSDWHCNGASLIIRKALGLPNKFLTRLPNGKTLGEQALTVTKSYASLVEALLKHDVEMHRLQPITGGGITKLASHRVPFRYRIHTWVSLPPVCEFMRCQFGLSVEDSYSTFNNGIGFCFVVPKGAVRDMKRMAKSLDHELVEIGEVVEGCNEVVLEHEGGIVLHHPGD